MPEETNKDVVKRNQDILKESFGGEPISLDPVNTDPNKEEAGDGGLSSLTVSGGQFTEPVAPLTGENIDTPLTPGGTNFTQDINDPVPATGVTTSGMGTVDDGTREPDISVGQTPTTDIQSTGTPISPIKYASQMTQEEIDEYLGKTVPETQDIAPTGPKTYTTPTGVRVDENGNVVSTPDEQNKSDALMEYYGIDSSQFDERQDTSGFIQDLYGSMFRNLGLDSLREEISESNLELQKWQDETADLVASIQDNPWQDAGSKEQRISRLLEKRTIKENNLIARLNRASDLQERGRAEARWVTQTALGAYYKDREYQTDLMQDAMDRAERASATDGGFTLSKGQIRYDDFGNIIAYGPSGGGGAGLNLSATEIKDARNKFEAETNLINLSTKYRDLIEEHGHTNAFLKPTIRGQVLGVRGQIVSAYRDAMSLGALDQGVLDLMSIILGPEPVSAGISFGGRARQIVSSMDELLAQTKASRLVTAEKLGLPVPNDPIQGARTWENSANDSFALPN